MLDADFVKSHGLGNDYIVVDATRFPVPLTPERVRLLCHRHLGLGSDGILEVTAGNDRFFVRIWNPDGSEAERSGNGLRLAAKFLAEHAPELRHLVAEMESGGERLDLREQPVDQLLRAAHRQRRDVVDRLVRVELGALAARMRERVHDLAPDAEQPELEDGEQPHRPRADDHAFRPDRGRCRFVHVRHLGAAIAGDRTAGPAF